MWLRKVSFAHRVSLVLRFAVGKLGTGKDAWTTKRRFYIVIAKAKSSEPKYTQLYFTN